MSCLGIKGYSKKSDLLRSDSDSSLVDGDSKPGCCSKLKGIKITAIVLNALVLVVVVTAVILYFTNPTVKTAFQHAFTFLKGHTNVGLPVAGGMIAAGLGLVTFNICAFRQQKEQLVKPLLYDIDETLFTDAYLTTNPLYDGT